MSKLPLRKQTRHWHFSVLIKWINTNKHPAGKRGIARIGHAKNLNFLKIKLVKVCKLLQEKWKGLVTQNGTKTAEADRETNTVRNLKNDMQYKKFETLDVIKGRVKLETDIDRNATHM